jgi:drug/metabolite transporter (DMT)-like permease
LAFLGLTNIVIPYLLIAWGQQYISTGMASILNALVPIFTFVLAAGVFHDEPVTRLRVGGLVLGFVGVVLLALPSLGAAVDDTGAVLALQGMLTVAAAGVSYAVAAVYTRRRLTTQPLVRASDGTWRPPTPLELALGSTLIALLVVAVLALALERPAEGLLHLPVSFASWFGLLWLGALGSGLAYLVFYAVLERWGPTRTTLVTYVIPVVAISLGFIFLGERLRPLELLGAAVVIGGVVLVNGAVGLRGAGRKANVPPASADLDVRAGS